MVNRLEVNILMLIEYLRYFIALNNYHSITKTSRMMHTTPQNVSRILKKIEDEMNTVLFTRNNNGIQLTEHGKQFLEFSKNTVFKFDELSSKFSFQNSEEIKSVTIYSNDFLNDFILNDALAPFVEEYPHILVNNIIVDYAEGFRKLENETESIGFLFYTEDTDYPNELDIIPFQEFMSVIVVSKTHPLANKRYITIEDLRACKIVVYSRNKYSDCGIFHLLNIDPIKEKIPVLSSGNLETCYHILTNSNYVFPSIYENFVKQDQFIQDHCVAIPIQNLSLSRTGIIKSQKLPLDSPQQLLINFILNYVNVNMAITKKQYNEML